MVSFPAHLAAAAALLVACGGDGTRAEPASARPEPGAPVSPAQGTPAPTPEPRPRSVGPATDTPGVPLDCQQFAPPPAPIPCAIVPAAVIELVAVAQANAHAVTMHSEAERRPHWARARAAIAGMPAVAPDTLPISVRVAAQNAALRIAFDTDDAALARSALAEVERLAMPAEQLQQLGSEPQGLEPWLGPPQQWRTRERGELVSLHSAIGPHAHYRMIAGRHRAIVHQLVAIDSTGAPHITPVVGQLELRASDAVEAPACVAELAVAALGCGHLDALAAIDADHPSTHFFQRKPDGSVGCNDCHSSSTFPIVADSRARDLETAERLATLARIAGRLRPGPAR